jgi:GTP-binding protein
MQPAPDRLFSRAKFLASAGTAREFPVDGLPEIAFVGRSNVGKSSAINALAGRRRLAFASKAPGRTQTVNFYDLGETARLVDLPGYGYARVPKSVRAEWERLVGSYFAADRPLAGVVVLMDARHPMTPPDERLLAWLGAFESRRIALLTKSDKLSRAEGNATLKATREKLKGECEDVILFSSTSDTGIEQVRELLRNWMAAGDAATGNKRPPA